MKKIIALLICIATLSIQAQIKGNKNVTTRTFDFDNVTDIKIDLYAKVTIDLSAEAELSITTDSNLFDFIDKEVIDGKIHFNQIEWIQPSQDIIISIGAPQLEKVFHDTHDITRIINVDNNRLNVTAPIGEVFIEGKTKELRLGSEQSKIDASEILADKVFVNLWSRGTVKVFPKEYLWAKVSKNGSLVYVNEPNSKEIKSYQHHRAHANPTSLEDPKFINFKIKNNSMNRNHFYVVGPKPNGSSFSYGFPMMPQAIRKENWTTGTKVYKVNKLGFRKLLVTIAAEDENKTVKLF